MASFREKLNAGHVLAGTFVKNTAPHSIEILGSVGFDFVVLDAEHAPFDRSALDLGLLATRAAGIAGVVRVADQSSSAILAALDLGADGVLVPHVVTAAQAAAVVAGSRYLGSRGYSNSPRAGGYGRVDMWRHVDMADERVAVIAMVEDPEGVDNVEAILAVEGLDAVFVGRGDLAVALDDREPAAPRVTEATDHILEAAAAARKQVLLFVSSADEAKAYRERGVMSAILSSDQGFLRLAARNAVQEFRGTK